MDNMGHEKDLFRYTSSTRKFDSPRDYERYESRSKSRQAYEQIEHQNLMNIARLIVQKRDGQSVLHLQLPQAFKTFIESQNYEHDMLTKLQHQLLSSVSNDPNTMELHLNSKVVDEIRQTV